MPVRDDILQKVVERVTSLLDSSSLYEGQQQIRTIFHRYKSRKMYKECYEVLEEGTVVLLSKKKYMEGFDLAKLLLQTLCECKSEDVSVSYKRLERIISKGPRAIENPDFTSKSAEVVEGYRFIKESIKNAKKIDFKEEDVRSLFDSAAAYLWDWQGWQILGQITILHTKSQNWTEMSKILQACVREKGTRPSEEQLFVCRSVLQIILYTESLKEAPVAAKKFLQSYHKLSPLPSSPYINFCNLAIQALEKSSKSLFSMLQEKYAPILKSPDAHLEYLCKKISNAYFFTGSGGGGLSSILRSVLGSFQTPPPSSSAKSS